MSVEICWFIRRYFPEVMAIENASFEYPWSEEEVTKILRERDCMGQVAVDESDRVLGYMIFAFRKTHVEILNFAVHPDFRRSGIGAKLAAKMTSKVPTKGRKRINAYVRETNLPALKFFASCGFRAIGIIRGHWDESAEDAIEMEYRTVDIVAVGNRVERFLKG